MLYEMLAGKPAFAGGTVSEVLAQRMLHAPPPVTRARADVQPWAARLVDRLLRPQPAHRFQSADEVIAAIDRSEVPRRLPAHRAHTRNPEGSADGKSGSVRVARGDP